VQRGVTLPGYLRGGERKRVMSCVDCRQATYLSEFQLPDFSVDPTITRVNGDSEKGIIVGSRKMMRVILYYNVIEC